MSSTMLKSIVAGLLLAVASAALAQSYPMKQVRVLTSAPAGPYDIMLRAISPASQNIRMRNPSMAPKRADFPIR